MGIDVVIDFVDVCGCGDYRMKIPAELKDALLLRPIGRSGGPQNHIEPAGPSAFLQSAKPPLIKFRDLEAALNGQQPANSIPFDVDVSFENATAITSLVTVTIALRNQSITFIDEAGLRRGRINFRSRLNKLTGRGVEVFEDSIQIPAPAESATSAGDEITYIKKTFALPLGLYRLAIAVKDANNDHLGTWFRSIRVASVKRGS